MKTTPTPPCGTCNQDDATGFIRLKIATKVQRKK